MPAPQAIRDLIERFERNFDGYKSPQYNETQLRREFVDPFRVVRVDGGGDQDCRRLVYDPRGR